MAYEDILKEALPENLKKKCFYNDEWFNWNDAVKVIISIYRMCGTSKKRRLIFDTYDRDSYKYEQKDKAWIKGCLEAHNEMYRLKIYDMAYHVGNNFSSTAIVFYRNNGEIFLELKGDRCHNITMDLYDSDDVRALVDDAFDSGENYGVYHIKHHSGYNIPEITKLEK